MEVKNLIHIPKDLLPIVKIGEREFFFTKEKFQFQCAKCLHVMAVVPGEYDRRRTRPLYIDPYCYCQTIEKEESGPIHAVTPQDLEEEAVKPVKDRIKHLTTDEGTPDTLL